MLSFGGNNKMKIVSTPKKIYYKILKSNLTTKISIYYITILCISIIVVSMVYSSINSQNITQKTSASAQQTLEALDENMSYLVSNVSQFSTYVFCDEQIQSALSNTHQKGIDTTYQENVNKSLTNVILSCDDITSVFLFDNYNNTYFMSRTQGSNILSDDVKSASWYEKVEKAKGYPVWVMNDDKLIRSSSNDLPVSLVRMVYSTYTFQPIGVLVMNINKSFVNNIFREIASEDTSQFYIVDENYNYITEKPKDNSDKIIDYIKEFSGKSNSKIIHLDGQEVMLSSRKSSYLDWSIIGIMPMNELALKTKDTGVVVLITIIINIVFICFGQGYFARIIVKPIRHMRSFMTEIKSGKFHKIPIDPIRDDEIVELKHSYNIMIDQIQHLLQKVKSEQRQLSLSEINMLRAQINPHFLYNTLDAVSALSLIEDNKSAYVLTQSLESFYRISLSSGRELISVNEEIECIKNYVQILNIRYKDSFDVIYYIDENILDENILKLILQPFVENAIAHGVRKQHDRGKIVIRGVKKEDRIIFEIEDNGIGMTEEKISEILNKKQLKGKGGFGIYASITRMTLYYGIENPVTIESEVDVGTTVKLSVPMLIKEENNG